jgi:hypothetical protein
MENVNVKVELVKGKYGFKHRLPYLEKKFKVISKGSLKVCPKEIMVLITPKRGDTHYIAYVQD